VKSLVCGGKLWCDEFEKNISVFSEGGIVMSRWIHRNRFGVMTAVLLTLFTAFALLDVFVIPHEYRAEEATSTELRITKVGSEESDDAGAGQTGATGGDDAGQTGATGGDDAGQTGTTGEDGSGQTGATGGDDAGQNGDNTGGDSSGGDGGKTASTEPVVTDSSYRDENISITVTQYRVNETTVYVADVTVSSPEYLKSALAKGKYGRNIKEETSQIAEEAGAILAINGDFYGARTSGYVIRNGVLYRSQSADNEDLVMYSDGTFEIVSEETVSASELLESGAYQVWSFGPALIENATIAVTKKDEVGKAMASNPRTAVARVSDNRYLFVVADGRTDESEGLSLYEFAQFLQSLGVQTAYNLDGGGSSTMVFMGEVVNKPTTGGSRISERSVSDIVYIGY